MKQRTNMTAAVLLFCLYVLSSPAAGNNALYATYIHENCYEKPYATVCINHGGSATQQFRYLNLWTNIGTLPGPWSWDLQNKAAWDALQQNHGSCQLHVDIGANGGYGTLIKAAPSGWYRVSGIGRNTAWEFRSTNCIDTVLGMGTTNFVFSGGELDEPSGQYWNSADGTMQFHLTVNGIKIGYTSITNIDGPPDWVANSNCTASGIPPSIDLGNLLRGTSIRRTVPFELICRGGTATANLTFLENTIKSDQVTFTTSWCTSSQADCAPSMNMSVNEVGSSGYLSIIATAAKGASGGEYLGSAVAVIRYD